MLIACAFNYDAHTTEFESLGRVPVLKARMNADLHMTGELRNTGSGNLFVIFGEPDIDVLDGGDGQVQVRVNGVDVFHPNTGEVRSDGPEGIACWFIDTDYNQESFFVRHEDAYFLGAGDPYKSLKTTLKAEIDEDAWATLHSAESRPFPRPESGRIAVKVIRRGRSRARALLNWVSQGQCLGRCKVRRRAERVVRPARAKNRRRRVLVVTICSRKPMRAVQRARLWAITCTASQAPLAANRPDGRWFSPTPYLRSRMAFSISAWRRWSASSSRVSPSRSVMNP